MDDAIVLIILLCLMLMFLKNKNALNPVSTAKSVFESETNAYGLNPTRKQTKILITDIKTEIAHTPPTSFYDLIFRYHIFE